jgi:flavin-binding protein dodecin
MMSEHVYKKIELVGSSKTSIEDAVQSAIKKAGETIKNLRWFEILETRGQIVEDEVAFWQVSIKVGFTVDND